MKIPRPETGFQKSNSANHYSNLKAMNGPRYNFLCLYILDLHNNYVEDPMVFKGNLLSPPRMPNIFKKSLSEAIKNINVK